jgi:hypothetical protein
MSAHRASASSEAEDRDGSSLVGGIRVEDKRVSQLTAQAGSEAAISRGKYLAAGIVVVGMLGAVGAALRPVWAARHAARMASVSGTTGPHTAVPATRSAEVARRTLAAARGESLPQEEQARLDALLARLRELQQRHRDRHPLWYMLPASSSTVSSGAQLDLGPAPGAQPPAPQQRGDAGSATALQ